MQEDKSSEVSCAGGQEFLRSAVQDGRSSWGQGRSGQVNSGASEEIFVLQECRSSEIFS